MTIQSWAVYAGAAALLFACWFIPWWLKVEDRLKKLEKRDERPIVPCQEVLVYRGPAQSLNVNFRQMRSYNHPDGRAFDLRRTPEGRWEHRLDEETWQRDREEQIAKYRAAKGTDKYVYEPSFEEMTGFSLSEFAAWEAGGGTTSDRVPAARRWRPLPHLLEPLEQIVETGYQRYINGQSMAPQMTEDWSA